MLEDETEVLAAGTNPPAQGYEPNRPELEHVQAHRLTVCTPRGRHDPQRDVVAMGRDGMSPRLQLDIVEQFRCVLRGHERFRLQAEQ
eukprot:5428238-Prorocentrum_lima.AAC.1